MINNAMLETIRQATSVLCLSHINPDGDAVGSLLGAGWLLRSLGKQPVLALQDRPPAEFHFLPGVQDIITGDRDDYEQAVRNHPFDLIIVLDSSSPDRMGNTYHPAVHDHSTVLVIDHHITNTLFGQINWVAPDCAATCQMVLYLADAFGVAANGPMAECLLTGLVTDTLCFRTNSTDARVMEAAMRLMQGGAQLANITAHTVNRQPFSLIRLWGMVLPAVQLADRVIWATLRQEQFAEAGHPGDDLNLSSFLVSADEADMSAVFTEKTDGAGQTVVECSLRAKPNFDVSATALKLGGGGHPAASGCTLPGDLAEVTATVIPLLQSARRQQAGAGTSILGDPAHG
jgi:bifunctional oligoribonuclease and PAP phosphatase NrnA